MHCESMSGKRLTCADEMNATCPTAQWGSIEENSARGKNPVIYEIVRFFLFTSLCIVPWHSNYLPDKERQIKQFWTLTRVHKIVSRYQEFVIEFLESCYKLWLVCCLNKRAPEPTSWCNLHLCFIPPSLVWVFHRLIVCGGNVLHVLG